MNCAIQHSFLFNSISIMFKFSLKMFLPTVVLCASMAAATADDVSALTSADAQPGVVTARVHGLVCDFCARAIIKVFRRRDEVSDITVDLSAGNVVIYIHPGTCLPDAVTTELLTDAGFKAVAIEGGCPDGEVQQ